MNHEQKAADKQAPKGVEDAAKGLTVEQLLKDRRGMVIKKASVGITEAFGLYE
mgnify:CR=1 FL=1